MQCTWLFHAVIIQDKRAFFLTQLLQGTVQIGHKKITNCLFRSINRFIHKQICILITFLCAVTISHMGSWEYSRK